MIATRALKLLSTAKLSAALTQLTSVQKMSDEIYSNIIYKSLDAVLQTLHQEKYQHLDGVRQVLSRYHTFLDEIKHDEHVEDDGKKYPLIVLEGLDGCGKSTITKRLAATLHAKLMTTPPPCISDIRRLFDELEYKDVRAAFYSLGNYIAAKQIETVLHKKPVVLDRFWHTTVAYTLAQAITDNPEIYKMLPEGHHLYEWPKDLLKPNLVVFLDVNERTRLLRMRNRTKYTTQEILLQEKQFRTSVSLIYDRITPHMAHVNGNLMKKKVEDSVLVLVNPLLPE